MILTTVLSLASLAAAPQAPDFKIQDAQGDRVLRTISLSNLIGVPLPLTAAPFGSLLSAHYGDDPFHNFVRSQPQIFSPDFVASQLSDYLDRRDPDLAENTWIETRGQRLVLTGARETVDMLIQLVRGVESEVARPIRVEAHLYEVPADAELPVTLGDGESLPGDSRLVWQSGAVTRSGYPASLSQHRYTMYVRDADVEVAVKQSISAPITRRLFEGVNLHVEPHATPGSDRLALLCHAVIGDLHQPMQSRPSGSREMTSIDVPVLRNDAATFGGVIANGGAVVLHVGGRAESGANLALVVRARRDAGPRRQRLNDISIVPHTALTTRSLRSWVGSESFDNEGPDRVLPLSVQGEEWTEDVSFDLDSVMDMMRSVAADAIDNERLRIVDQGGYLLLEGPAQDRQAVIAAMKALHDQHLDTVACHVVTDLHPVDGASDSAFGSTGDAGPADRMHRITAPVFVGRPHFFLHGLESTMTDKIYVEIAEEASAVNPVVSSTFSGVLASLAALHGADGLTALADLHVSHVAQPERRPADTGKGGELYVPKIGRSRFAHRGPVPQDGFEVLGDAGVVEFGGSRWVMRQKLRLADVPN